MSRPSTRTSARCSPSRADEATQAALGRGTGGHVARSLAHAREIRARGLRLKLNTVVTALNWREDMSEFVRQVQPERWKVFQVLPVGGQNDGAVELKALLVPTCGSDCGVSGPPGAKRDHVSRSSPVPAVASFPRNASLSLEAKTLEVQVGDIE